LTDRRLAIVGHAVLLESLVCKLANLATLVSNRRILRYHHAMRTGTATTIRSIETPSAQAELNRWALPNTHRT
jgi:hypothetical protein